MLQPGCRFQGGLICRSMRSLSELLRAVLISPQVLVTIGGIFPGFLRMQRQWGTAFRFLYLVGMAFDFLAFP